MKDIKAYKRFQGKAFNHAQAANAAESTGKLEPLMPYEAQFNDGFDAAAEDAMNATDHASTPEGIFLASLT